jgi:hypothetical protein
MDVAMGEYCAFENEVLDVSKYTALTPLLLLILCKLSFPIVGLKCLVGLLWHLSNLTKWSVVFREFIEHIFQFLGEAILHVVSFDTDASEPAL